MENPHTLKLEKLSNFHYLYNGLVRSYSRSNSHFEKKINDFNEKIEEYHSILIDKNAIDKASSPSDLATPLDENSDFTEIARRAASFFEQGLQMYLTSTTMHINSSPLVEYYSFLQCVKGAVLLNFEIKNSKLFSYHGIKPDKTYLKPYIKAEVKIFGVFQTLLLLKGSKDDLHDFLNNKYDLRLRSLVEGKLIKGVGNVPKEIRVPMDYPIPAFIVSWMLSSLVRYKPKIWQDIYYGIKDSLILKIHEYRRKEVVEAIDSILPYYYDDKTIVV